MKIILAPQALKGSLDAAAVGQAMAEGARIALPDAEIAIIPVADGGEGTVSALVAATNGQLLLTRVTGPLGEPVEAEWGLLGADSAESDEKTAVIEMAAAAGLPLVPRPQRDPRVTTTYGVGELLRAALEMGCKRILIGIGGSATNDGGVGMAQALGARLLDANGGDLPPGGAALAQLAHIDISGMDPRLAQSAVRVASDVTNPLTGPKGASAVYGPQKGATPEMVAELDAALAHYADILKRDLSVDVADIPGAGAAGGLGAGLLAFAQAELVPGARLVFEALRFDERISGADLIFTAEGQLDTQTAYGKAVGAVAAAGQRQGIPVVALAGAVAMDDAALRALGLSAALPLPDGPLTLEESMARAADLTRNATLRALRLILLLK
ncbi:MAG TPA: glycerate kinase [Ktedonobacterales bacterium]|jgi:glycerate 2-kinase|nr:glycerate kinase [Ktedonobacterales bacterium]